MTSAIGLLRTFAATLDKEAMENPPSDIPDKRSTNGGALSEEGRFEKTSTKNITDSPINNTDTAPSLQNNSSENENDSMETEQDFVVLATHSDPMDSGIKKGRIMTPEGVSPAKRPSKKSKRGTTATSTGGLENTPKIQRGSYPPPNDVREDGSKTTEQAEVLEDIMRLDLPRQIRDIIRPGINLMTNDEHKDNNCVQENEKELALQLVIMKLFEEISEEDLLNIDTDELRNPLSDNVLLSIDMDSLGEDLRIRKLVKEMERNITDNELLALGDKNAHMIKQAYIKKLKKLPTDTLERRRAHKNQYQKLHQRLSMSKPDGSNT